MVTATITTEKSRIYVACLAAYNNGILHGAWIDAAGDAWGICEGVAAMLVLTCSFDCMATFERGL